MSERGLAGREAAAQWHETIADNWRARPPSALKVEGLRAAPVPWAHGSNRNNEG